MTKLMGSSNSLLCALRGAYRGSTRVDKFRVATIAATIYHIWGIRNRKLFEDERPNLELVVRNIQIDMHRLRALQFT